MSLSVTADLLMENYHKAYPTSTLVIYKYAAPGGSSTCRGNLLSHIQLIDQDWLDIYKLTKSSELMMMTSDEIKSKAFPFVFDTKSETDSEKRCENLYESLNNTFPNYNVNVFVFKNNWSGSMTNTKGSVTFTKEYGSDVVIILN